ncbi:MAG: Ig-like domain-containing protein, partial [Acidimicrobiales bacterium]|nr:Ig-like domain-containing protein [Acidimicrobiales bacterium]
MSITVLPPNVGPEVVISSPSVGQGVIVGATLKVIASATDSDGEVTEVEILVNGESLAKRSEGPFEADWVLVRAGMQSVTVRATDNDEAASEVSLRVAVYGDTPVPVDGLRLWLDAGEEVTVSDVGVVSGWGDRSLFGHDVSQSELGLQPALSVDAINGRAAVLFDGEDDVLALVGVAGAELLS